MRKTLSHSSSAAVAATILVRLDAMQLLCVSTGSLVPCTTNLHPAAVPTTAFAAIAVMPQMIGWLQLADR